MYFSDTLKKYLAHHCVCPRSFQNITNYRSAYPRWRTSRFGSRGSLLSRLPIITGKLVDDDDLPRTWVCWGFALGRMLSTWLWFKHNTWITLHYLLNNGRRDKTGWGLTMSLSKNKPTCFLKIMVWNVFYKYLYKTLSQSGHHISSVTVNETKHLITFLIRCFVLHKFWPIYSVSPKK